MRRLSRFSKALLGVLIACALAPAGAQAQNPTVEPEPAGPNCPAGGLKITVTPAPTEEVPTPEPVVHYVCHGVAGEPGAPGSDGSPGSDGIDGANGMDGADGMDGGGFDEPEPVTPAQTQACRTSRVLNFKLPARFRGVRSASLRFNGARRTVAVRARRVQINMRGLACGYYPMLVARRGITPVLRVWRVTPTRIIRVAF